MNYFVRVGIAVSILINVMLGGHFDQSFSARNYEWKKSGHLNLVWLFDLIFFFDKNHCLCSWTYWILKKGNNT